MKSRFNKNNHYCVVHFTPKMMTDKTFFLFQYGRHFTDKEMENYINWHCLNQPQPLRPTKIEYRVKPERILEVEQEDQYVDWNNVSRRFYKDYKNEIESELVW